MRDVPPGTRLDIRLDKNDNSKPGEEPINRVDAAALKYDITYFQEDIRSRQKADIDLIQDLNDIQNPTFSEKFSRPIGKIAMKTKIMLDGAQATVYGEKPTNSDNQNTTLVNELHKEFRKPKKYNKTRIRYYK